jgi:hypothetical protein
VDGVVKDIDRLCSPTAEAEDDAIVDVDITVLLVFAVVELAIARFDDDNDVVVNVADL